MGATYLERCEVASSSLPLISEPCLGLAAVNLSLQRCVSQINRADSLLAIMLRILTSAALLQRFDAGVADSAGVNHLIGSWLALVHLKLCFGRFFSCDSFYCHT